jgi:hypothetical protein
MDFQNIINNIQDLDAVINSFDPSIIDAFNESMEIDQNEDDEVLNEAYDEIMNNIFNCQTGGSNDYFTVQSVFHDEYHDYNTEKFKFDIKFKTIEGPFSLVNNQITRLFQELYNFLNSKCGPQDYVDVIFNHDDLFYPIETNFHVFKNLSPQLLLETVDNVCQSRHMVRVDENFKVSIIITKVPRGGINENIFENAKGIN